MKNSANHFISTQKLLDTRLDELNDIVRQQNRFQKHDVCSTQTIE